MEMKLAAAKAIAELVTEDDIKNGIIIPSPFNKDVSRKIAEMVADAAVKSGVSNNSNNHTFLLFNIFKSKINI